MTYESQTSRTSADVADFLQLFGPPPVLSSESIEAYELMMARLLECFAPQDFMEQLLVKEIADSTWEATRVMRHKTLVMERRVRDRLGHQEARRKLAAQPKDAPSDPKAAKWKPATPEDILDGLVAEVDAILLPPATELAHARALELGMDYHESLDKALITALARRDKALEQLERYRDGLGAQLRQASDKIINDKIINGKIINDSTTDELRSSEHQQ